MQAGKPSAVIAHEKMKEVYITLFIFWQDIRAKHISKGKNMKQSVRVGVGFQVIPVDDDGDKATPNLNLDVLKAGCAALLRPQRLGVEALELMM